MNTKAILYLITIFFSNFIVAQSQIDIKKTIDCLNSKVITYNVGITKFELLEKTNTIISNIDSLNKVYIWSYEAKSNYNKHDFKLLIDYYYSNDKITVKKLEKSMLEFHFLEIKKLETEYIVRVENLIIKINITNKFEESYQYLKSIIFRLILDYINNCKI